MKPSSTFPTLALSALLATCGLAALPGTAQAFVTSQQGSVCRASGESTVGGLFYGNSSVYTGTFPKSIICPVVLTFTQNDIFVIVDFSITPAALGVPSPLFGCTLTSRDSVGFYLASSSFSVPNPVSKTYFSKALTLHTWQVPLLSTLTLACALPPNSEVFDVVVSN